MKNNKKFLPLFVRLFLVYTSGWGQPIMLQQVTNAYVNDSLIPAFNGGNQAINWPHPTLADIDGDGDFDLFVGYSSGRIMLFRNIGGIYQHKFVLETDYYGAVNVGSSAAPTFYDIDNDGDVDLFVGNGYAAGYGGNVAFYENIGDSNNASWMLREDSVAQLDAYDNAVPTIADLDGDGDGDLIVGGGYGKLFYSENIGTPDSVAWAAQTINYAGINVGFKAAPLLSDMSCDGKPDLLIGNDRGKMFYYKNLGANNNGEIAWLKITEIFTGVDFTHLDYTAPAVADLNGDGNKDILESEHYGNINLFLNAGNNCNFIPNWVTGDLLSGTIDVGQDAFPAFVDIDNDCDLDMFIGKANGQIRFYRNDFTDIEPNWVLVTENFLGFDTGLILTGSRRSAPFFSDYDLDGDKDLAIATLGNNPATIWLYENKIDSFDLVSVKQGPSVGGYFFMAADFNKDSLVDLVYTVQSSPNDLIVIVRNSGLSIPWSISTADTFYVGQINSATALDYDYDGDQDLLIKKLGVIDLWLYRNLSTSDSIIWNTENLSSVIPTTSLYNCTWADVDNNFTLDVFEGFPTGGIKFWKNTTLWSKFVYQTDMLTVTFQDSSFSGATEWFWDFGDGTTSTEQNPSHDYPTPDEYDVCLILKNDCKESKICQTVTVCSAPATEFSYQQNNLTVNFQNASIGADSLTWDFDDGVISKDANPTHTYATNGIYVVCLATQNECGADTFCLEVSVVVSTNTGSISDWKPVVYPNPSTGIVIIDWQYSGSQKAMLTIYDQLGRQIQQFKKGEERQTVWDGIDANGNSVSSGVYHFKFSLGEAIWFEKVLLIGN